MLFITMLFIIGYVNVSPDFFRLAQKWLDKKAKINFKICDVTDRQKCNSNAHMTQYLKR